MLTDDERDDVFLAAWPLLRQMGDDYVTRIHIRRERPITRSRDVTGTDEGQLEDGFNTAEAVAVAARASDLRTFSDFGVITAPSDPSFANKPSDTVTFFESALSGDPQSIRGLGWVTTGMTTGEVLVDQNSSRLTAATDAGALKSPPAGWRITFPAGQNDGTSGFAHFNMWRAGRGASSAGFGQTTKLYLCYWLYIPTADFQNQATGTKVGYISYGLLNRQNECFLMLRGDFASTASKPNGTLMTQMQLVWRIQEGNTDGSFDQSGVERLPNAGTSAQRLIRCGVRHKIEQLLIKNSPAGAANGVGKVWLDGVLIHNWSNIVWTNAGAPNGFYEAHWDPVWGGDSGQVRPQNRDDTWIIDHFYGAGLP